MPDTQTQTITLRIPTPLRSYTEDQSTVDVTASTVAEALDSLVERYPDLEDNLFTEDGDLRQFVNIYVDDEDIRYQDGTETTLDDASEVSIVPSIAGG